MAVYQAEKEGLENFSVLVSQVLVPPAIKALLASPENRVQGYLAAGHVCAIMGWEEYIPIAEEYKVPIAVTGFEPVDILSGILSVVNQLEKGEGRVENCYSRIVKKEGNPAARELISKVFEISDRNWRGIGLIPESGFRLKEKYRAFDAEKIFDLAGITTREHAECISGLILQGLKKPVDCPSFGTACTPEFPLGATMVSSEGACAAYYSYSRKK